MDFATLFCGVATASLVASAMAGLLWLFGRLGAGLIPGAWLHTMWWLFVVRLAWPLLVAGLVLTQSGLGLGLGGIEGASGTPGLEQTSINAGVNDGILPAGHSGVVSSWLATGVTRPLTTVDAGLVGIFTWNLYSQLTIPRNLGVALSVIWAFGTLVGVLCLAGAALRARQGLRLATFPREGLAYDRFQACLSKVLLRGQVTLALSADLAGPAVYGLSRPVVCLPRDLAARLDATALDHIIAHELAHVRRGDQWFNALLVAIRVVYWFNPCVWLACRHVDRLRELACDETVVGGWSAPERQAYGNTLVAVAALARSCGHRYPVPGLARRTTEIRRRIIMIGKPVKRRWIAVPLVLALMALAICGGLVNATEPIFSARQKAFLPAVLVAGGSFMANGKPVRLSSFYMGQTEVTQLQYQRLTGKSPSWFGLEPQAAKRPVEQVNWFDALEFCNALSLQDGLQPVYQIDGKSVACDFTRNGWRLPTEAEWEFAARGGLKTRGFAWAGSAGVDEVAWYAGNSGGVPQAVATKAPNELGLFDMSGNAAEWCNDLAGDYPSGEQDPRGAAAGWSRATRGGAAGSSAYMTSVFDPNSSDPWRGSNQIGFRVVRRAM